MTLFEECKEALSADFSIAEGHDYENVIRLLNQYPFVHGNLNWNNINYSDYECIYDLLHENDIANCDVFVFSDDASVPIFRTNLKLLAENIYDVTALSSKLFIFNDSFILQPLFPTEIIRLGIRY